MDHAGDDKYSKGQPSNATSSSSYEFCKSYKISEALH